MTIKLLIISMLLVAMSNIGIAAQIYVDIDALGNEDGSNWENAFRNLNDALSISQSGDVIWVAEGTYKPGGETGGRNDVFEINQNVKLYGGFDGSEDNFEQRNFQLNSTVLSGDHNDDDNHGDFEVNKTDNSIHVIYIDSLVSDSSRIDGFTIQGGYSEIESMTEDERNGGGIISFGHSTIANCLFTNNFADLGGGIYSNSQSSRRIVNCEFIENMSDGRGGGVYVSLGSIEFRSCQFESNFTSVGTGIAAATYNCASIFNGCNFFRNESMFAEAAVRIRGSDLDSLISTKFNNCEFRENQEALFLQDQVNAEINSCNFIENFEGALHCDMNGGKLNIDKSSFSNNVNESSSGGAISITKLLGEYLISDVVIKNCSFRSNLAYDKGGAIYSRFVNLSVVNSILANNEVTDPVPGYWFGEGGAVYIYSNNDDITHSQIINSTIANNLSSFGSGISIYFQDQDTLSTLILQNVILANSDDNFNASGGNEEVISQGGNLSNDNSISEFLILPKDLNNTDPLFFDPYNFDYTLTLESPAIDAGEELNAPLYDISGNPRINAPDIGAYENQDVISIVKEFDEYGFLSGYFSSSNKLHIDFSHDYRGEIEFSIMTLEGRLIKSETENKFDSELNYLMNVNSLPRSQYILIAKSNEFLYGMFFQLF